MSVIKRCIAYLQENFKNLKNKNILAFQVLPKEVHVVFQSIQLEERSVKSKSGAFEIILTFDDCLNNKKTEKFIQFKIVLTKMHFSHQMNDCKKRKQIRRNLRSVLRDTLSPQLSEFSQKRNGYNYTFSKHFLG